MITANPVPHPRFVYLAGPILGCTDGEANDWRRTVDKHLRPHNIIGVSPLRCEPLHGERYSMDYPDPRFGTARAIAAKNRFDVLNCDMGLFYIPKPIRTEDETADMFNKWGADLTKVRDRFSAFKAGMQAAKLHSFGTVVELAWMHGLGKQTIVVSDDPFIKNHPVLDAVTNWKLDSFEEAVDVITGVLGAYSGGKNV